MAQEYYSKSMEIARKISASYDKPFDKHSGDLKLIYLDIDGVMCTHRACAAIGEMGTMDYLDPIACKLVENLITEFSAKVVISSTWRITRCKREMYQLFRCAGHHILANAIHGRWRTPELNGYTGFAGKRGREIESSLSEIENHEHVTAYVILDDDSDMLDYQQPFFVKCDTYDGLGFWGYEHARRILGGAK